MATQRVAVVWAGLGAGAVLYSMARAQQQSGPSIPIRYCSSANTADMEAITSNWQSEGLCFDNCTELKYALAILQDTNCWCSNYIPNPADQKPLEDCQEPCPGFPPDHCGGDGVYGYIEVSGFKPSGTAAPGGPSPHPTMSNGNSDTPSVTTITVGDTVKTVTVTPTSAQSQNAVASGSDGLASGAIAGIVIGIVAAIAVTAFFAWLWWTRYRKKAESDSNPLGSPMRSGGSPSGAPTPQMADMSDGRYAASAASGQPVWDSQNRRRSHLMPVDPRLDPFIYSSDQNRSRESFTSLQDNQDYSRRVHQPQRVLRAVNPDPEED